MRWVGIDKDTVSRSYGKYSWYYEIEKIGYKCHLSDIQAAIGLVQLKKLDSHLNFGRKRVAERYNKAFRDMDWIKTPVEKEWVNRVYWNYVIQVNERDKLGEYLNEKGISYGVHYMPNHLHPFYKKLIDEGKIPKANVPVTEEVWKRIMSLPIYADLEDEKVDLIIESVRNFKR